MQAKIDYLNTILKSLKIVWRNKYLWVLGFFSAGLLLFNNFSPRLNFSFDEAAWQKWRIGSLLGNALDFFSGNPWRIASFAIGFVILALLFIILGCLSQGGLIYAVNQTLTSNKPRLSLRKSLLAARPFFFRILGMDALFGLGAALTVAIFATPPILFFIFQKKIIISLALALIGGLIAFVLILFILFLLRYGVIFITLENKRIWAAFTAAYKLVIRNVFATIIINILIWAMNLLLSCSYVLAFFILLVPLALVALVLWLVLHYLTIPVMLILLFAAATAIGIVLAGLISAFEATAWVLSWKQLKSAKYKI